MPSSRTAKRLLLGRRKTTDQLGAAVLPKRLALPAFASDALSSNAYATQEILVVLSLAGFAFYGYAPGVAAAVVVMFVIIVVAYRQQVREYPSGGGDYEVVSRNVGRRGGVFAAAALLVDYILIVAVSTSAAAATITSLAPALADYLVPLAVALIAFVATIQLRGMREAGTAFALGTYLFVAAILVMLVVGVARIAAGQDIKAESADWVIQTDAAAPVGLALVVLLARAFASGTTALTGVAAIANGVPYFTEPKPRNAARTLSLLAVVSMTMFIGITWLALATDVKVAVDSAALLGLPDGEQQKTVIAQVALAVFSGFPPAAYAVLVATAIVLVVAATTAFNGFPALGSILARDGYLPRQLRNRGDRLAFSNGILILAALAAIIVLVFQASVTQIIQLYIVGVFTSFSLSQFGMVRHWIGELGGGERARGPVWRGLAVSATGFLVSAASLVAVLVGKFGYGAWIVCLAIPALYALMSAIRRHYDSVERLVVVEPGTKVTLPSRVQAVVLVARVDAPTLRALRYAKSQRPTTVEAVHVDVTGDGGRDVAAAWDRRGIDVPLQLVASPYREVVRPVLEYVVGLRRSSPRDLVMVYLPTYRADRWWEHLLHQQTALRLRNRLGRLPGVMVASVPQVVPRATAKAAGDDAEDAPAAYES